MFLTRHEWFTPPSAVWRGVAPPAAGCVRDKQTIHILLLVFQVRIWYFSPSEYQH